MKKQIVLIENDNDFRWVLTGMLQELGFQVSSFAQVENIEELLSLPANAYLVDENLPGINGHTLCIILKSKPATKLIPVILMSGSVELIAMATLSDADRYLAKPFNQEELKKVLGEVVPTDPAI